MRIEVGDFTETFVPVVNWFTIRTIFVMSQVLGLNTAQPDYTAVSPQADLNEDVFMEMPRNYKDSGYVYKLKKSLYSLR